MHSRHNTSTNPSTKQPNGSLRTNRLVVIVAGFVLMLMSLWSLPSYSQETASGDHVTVRWLAPDTFKAGQTERIGFYFEVAPEWHVYWRNAGDSGAAPRFNVKTEGGNVSDIEWPFPTRLPIAHLTNLGYDGNVAYLLPVTPDADAQQLLLTVDLEWLVCKVDCLPGFGKMTLTRPVGTKSKWQSDDLALRDQFLDQVPKPQSQCPWTAVNFSAVGESQLQLNLTIRKQSKSEPTLFPLDGELFSAGKPLVKKVDDSLQILFGRMPGSKVTETTSILISNGKQSWQLSDIPFTAKTASAGTGTQSEITQPIWLLVLLAFAGGIILNLMPCVFPVLSIKLLGLIETPAPKRIQEALVYTAGVLVTFAALGGLLLFLRSTGNVLGWGFQLQSAPVILGLIMLFWLMALSFSGVFEFGNRLMTMAGDHRGGAFVTGILAVFVATPCTGPFMGVALGAAAVLPATHAMAIFLGLGLGLAAPFVLLCFSPALLNRLPKPGAWMETLRQFLAFPLYLTVIWLLWVLGQLIGDMGWLIGTLLMLTLVFVIWLGRSQKRWQHWLAVIIAIVAIVAAFTTALNIAPTASKTVTAETSAWQSFDPALIQQARDQGQAVFVDYTAAWCITCQVNKKLVLDTDEVQDLFKENNVLLVRADWTHHDPAITKSLETFGRNSLPVYAWYAKGTKQAELLPQILQTRMIRELFD